MEESLEIEVDIPDYVLTPLSFASFIEQFLKGFLLQKTQIPYPYNWLKSCINRRRRQEQETQEIEGNRTNNFRIESQYRIASKFYDGLEDVLQQLASELSKNSVSEIIILFGPSPLCPKEVCRIKIPILALGHFEDVHLGKALKLQHNALRQIFMSDAWMDSIDSSLSCMNTFIFLTKHRDDGLDMPLFRACNPLNIPKKVKQYTIKVNWDSCRDYSCCGILDESKETCEYEDTEYSKNILWSQSPPKDTEKNILWYQFDQSLEGFKNIYVNGKSVSELW